MPQKYTSSHDFQWFRFNCFCLKSYWRIDYDVVPLVLFQVNQTNCIFRSFGIHNLKITRQAKIHLELSQL